MSKKRGGGGIWCRFDKKKSKSKEIFPPGCSLNFPFLTQDDPVSEDKGQLSLFCHPVLQNVDLI